MRAVVAAGLIGIIIGVAGTVAVYEWRYRPANTFEGMAPANQFEGSPPANYSNSSPPVFSSDPSKRPETGAVNQPETGAVNQPRK